MIYKNMSRISGTDKKKIDKFRLISAEIKHNDNDINKNNTLFVIWIVMINTEANIGLKQSCGNDDYQETVPKNKKY